MDSHHRRHSHRALLALALGLAFVAVVPAFAAGPDDYLKEFDTLYNHVVLERTGTIVEMRSVTRQMCYRESAIDLADPERLLVPYTRGLFLAAVFQPSPRKVLMIGLGGGGFNRVFNRAFDCALLRTVEIDNRVKELAAQYMGFRESDRNQVVVADGRVHVKRNRSREKYDWIILDAYKGNCVPPHLKTTEFYREVSNCLESGGVVVSNLQNDSMLFDFDVATLNAAFPHVLYFQIPSTPNVIAIASPSKQADLRKMLSSFNRGSLPDALSKQVDFRGLAAGRFDPPPNREAKIMTDDFAPADYYKTVARTRTPGL
jgi:spermidine synthase